MRKLLSSLAPAQWRATDGVFVVARRAKRHFIPAVPSQSPLLVCTCYPAGPLFPAETDLLFEDKGATVPDALATEQ